MPHLDSDSADLLDFSKLAPYQPRKFVPLTVDLKDAAQVVSLYEKLLERHVSSADQLEQFLLDRSELTAAVFQQQSILYILMTCQTLDQSRSEDYKRFIETVVPAIKPVEDKLDRKFLASAQKNQLDNRRYEVLTRNTRADVELFRQENVELQKQDELLSQEYQTICGAMTVEFQGRTRTMPEMGKFVLDPDRQLRRDAWLAAAARRLKDADVLDDILDRMLSLRHTIATNAGFNNYIEYKFKEYHRFDYTIEDCVSYREAVEMIVVPALKTIARTRRELLKCDTLRPWDFDMRNPVDPKGRPPLKPFETVEQLKAGCAKIFAEISPVFAERFALIDALGLLDLQSRKGKAPGAYQASLTETRKPFIFSNAVGTHGDVATLLHEGGHAFHDIACADEPIFAYRCAPIEFCEVASMGMELLGSRFLSAFYGDADCRRARAEQLEGVIYVLTWIATIDAFQHWLYEHPGHSRSERNEAWLRIHNRFDGGLFDWSGLDAEHASAWQKQLHIYTCPLYYIEYAIAQMGALQLWANAQCDREAAVNAFRRGLSLGGSRPLPELFETAGLRFDFSAETIAKLLDTLLKDLVKSRD
ncbi:MAG: M3 family oligoendopeptidase [Sedimentisphaerales bacterium]|nr:M3 family oligoendopeptidase [Sedimentisphaerales bacterium]